MKNTKIIAVALVLIIGLGVLGISKNTVLAAKSHNKNKCGAPIAPSSVSISPTGVISWNNDASGNGYVIVQKSSLINAQNIYWSNLYTYRTKFETISPQLPLSITSFTDSKFFTINSPKYQLVEYNSCGDFVRSLEVSS